MRRGRRKRDAMPAIPLAVVLLPSKLEESPQRARIEALLQSPGAVGVEPPAIGYGSRPGLLRQGIAAGQAKRMNLPGQPRAIVAFDERQYPLARALLAEHPEAELWYAGRTGGVLHEAAQARAALRFEAEAEGPVREQNRPLHERMETLGIESGRLGSERL
jgi:hypothetical protein